MNQQDLLNELKRVTVSVERLFGLIPADQLDWRPRENMRNLMELANHLAQVPAIDLCILQGATHPEVQEREAALRRSQPSELAGVWQQGLEALSAYFSGLSDEQFHQQRGKAFYGHEAAMHEWLLEIITHTYHHRAQLFTYLKLMGLPVDMFTLY